MFLKMMVLGAPFRWLVRVVWFLRVDKDPRFWVMVPEASALVYRVFSVWLVSSTLVAWLACACKDPRFWVMVPEASAHACSTAFFVGVSLLLVGCRVCIVYYIHMPSLLSPAPSSRLGFSCLRRPLRAVGLWGLPPIFPRTFLSRGGLSARFVWLVNGC